MSNFPGNRPGKAAWTFPDDLATASPRPRANDQRAWLLALVGSGRCALVWEYLRLTRPGIVAMVLVTMAVAAAVSQPEGPASWEWIHSIVGAALVIAGAVAFNQRLEQASDARMARTASRPLPAGRLTARQVALFATSASGAGMAYLLAFTSPKVAMLTLASWLVYVWIYTPMKTLSAWQTPLGAIAGAMPTWIGAAAAGSSLFEAMPLALFGIVYFWQFPHAMAIAWLHRADFAAARLKVASVVDPSGRLAAGVALGGAVALLPSSLLPYFSGHAGWGYTVTAAVLGLGYVGAAAAFFRLTSEAWAKRLLWASLVYLPGICAALLATTWL